MFFPLLRAALRQGAAEVLNTHRKNSIKRDIALVGSRRSGSTLLMQILGRSPGLKSVDQPISILSADAPQSSTALGTSFSAAFDRQRPVETRVEWL